MMNKHKIILTSLFVSLGTRCIYVSTNVKLLLMNSLFQLATAVLHCFKDFLTRKI